MHIYPKHKTVIIDKYNKFVSKCTILKLQIYLIVCVWLELAGVFISVSCQGLQYFDPTSASHFCHKYSKLAPIDGLYLREFCFFKHTGCYTNLASPTNCCDWFLELILAFILIYNDKGLRPFFMWFLSEMYLVT